MSVNRTGTKKLEHYWTPKSATFTRSLSSTCLSGLSRARLPSIFLRLALSQDGHTRAADSTWSHREALKPWCSGLSLQHWVPVGSLATACRKCSHPVLPPSELRNQERTRLDSVRGPGQRLTTLQGLTYLGMNVTLMSRWVKKPTFQVLSFNLDMLLLISIAHKEGAPALLTVK